MINLTDLTRSYETQQQNFRRLRLRKRKFDQGDGAIKASFKDPSKPIAVKLDDLTVYFWRAHQHYQNTHNTAVHYPGLGSIYGADNDGLEGMSRLLPLWAAYITSPQAQPVLAEDMLRYIGRVLSRGTNPADPAYWGEITDRSTLICEAADIALAVWLVRGSVWLHLPKNDRVRILTWLKQVQGKKTADNNWHLFVVLIEKVIQSLDKSYQPEYMTQYQRIKSFYLGQGCFKDGENGQVDLYNAWGFHYCLYWLDQIDPDFDADFIKHSICEYSRWFQYLFTSNGCPLFGRSLCYRMAMPVPIQAANEYAPQEFSDGKILHILYSCWSFFINNGALKYGRPTQGVFEDDPTWLDPYTGPASAFWGTRSLVMYFYRSTAVDWTQTHLAPLPAEEEKKTLQVSSAGFCVTTEPSQKLSQVEFLRHYNRFYPQLVDTPSLKERIRALVLGISQRPTNNLLKKTVRVFDSRLSYYR
ncbi:DUF2264 domain-containing protein [Aestuariicella hydrocarbonica]|uniref:DUF2264 domain-containing protein n=1 Tax=Pseudomaricurvus hydrocarbonicus TaxID=1470433 RepID=A0A9E5JSD7_9GAMM|nr:DUF2264 domain-containing protein [Aestuariicella hydrocarbonica]NHO64678.1 DUF2264 domain-containing protein [Aestuariicella hydrocarbonica]